MKNKGVKKEGYDPSGTSAWAGYLRKMTMDDYDAVFKLWEETEYISLNECDTFEGMSLYLKHNNESCFVAEAGGKIIGSVLSGHDGRRGFLRHLVVAKTHRKKGIARDLVNEVLESLFAKGIGRCNIFVNKANAPGFDFWRHIGWWIVDDAFVTMQTATEAFNLVNDCGTSITATGATRRT